MKAKEIMGFRKTLDEPTLLPLARLTVDTRLDDIQENIILQARLSILDTLGCIIRGYSLEELEEVKQAIAVEKEIGSKQESTIFCSGDKVSTIGAARVNGYLGDILEFNDILNGHSGIGIIPSAMAVAEAQNASGKELIASIILGYEVVGRIYNTYYPNKKDYTECCAVPVGLPNSFGSAAVAARLFRLDEEKTFNALNIAGSLAAICPAETLEKGGTVKPYMFGGWPASVGIYSAICAKNGITGTPSILEGSIGLLPTMATDFDLSTITEGMGERWTLERHRRKAHACCGYTHSPIDASLSILRANELSVKDIKQIDISIAPYTIPLVGGEKPPNAITSKFSLRYLVAAAISKMSSIVPEDTLEEGYNINMAAGIPELMKRINIIPEPSFAHFSRSSVRVTTMDGKAYTKHLDHPKGDPENPLTEQELIDKFRMLAISLFEKEDVTRIIDEIYVLEERETISNLVDSLIAKK